MKTIIAGSRGFNNYEALCKICDFFVFTEVVSGTARGADKLGERYAEQNNIPIKRFPADWDKHGKSAGYIRNEEMAKYADRLIAFWDGESKGTKHMIDLARKHGLEVMVCITKASDSAIPYKCPVCEGRGIVHGGFYNSVPGAMGTSSVISEPCRQCSSSGIIWGN